MGVFKVEGLSKSFGERQIFQEVSLELRQGDRIGLIGPNGSGKTTMMRCLLGLDRPDSGQVTTPAGERISYVEQETRLGDRTLYEELATACSHLINWQQQIQEMEKQISGEKDPTRLAPLMKVYATIVEQFERGGGYEYQNTIRRVAAGLGFSETDLERNVNKFSGGQKTRICLGRALTGNPDFLFLDEPTNHLDINMIEWLEQFLSSYPGGVLMISHDRYFLNQVANRIIKLSGCRLTGYRGNYTDYLGQHIERQQAQQNAYEKQQEYINKTEEYIRKYKAGIKSRQARGRQSQLSRLELINAPESNETLDFQFPSPAECGDQVSELNRVTVAYGEQVIFEDLDLLVRHGDRLALIGPNGSGKTTLLKLLLGELKPRQGRVRLGSRVLPGYYSQEHEGLHQHNTIIDELTLTCGLSEESARNYLGRFMFHGDDVYKEISELSGGEEARLVILKLMLAGANFLVLDEPTNHLDIPTKEAMEDAILSFPGTYLIVSHDRYFLDKIATRVLELDSGRLVEYPGNYSYYRQKKTLLEQQAPVPVKKVADTAPKKAPHSNRYKVNTERLVKKLEIEIASLEAKLADLEQRINDPASYTNPTAGAKLAEEYAKVKVELEERYEQWVEATDEGNNCNFPT